MVVTRLKAVKALLLSFNFFLGAADQYNTTRVRRNFERIG